MARSLPPKLRAALDAALKAGDPTGARAIHAQLINHPDTPAPALYQLAMLEANVGAFPAADRLLEAARRRAPADPSIRVNHAQVRRALGDPAGALALLDGLPDGVSRHPAVLRLAGDSALECGDPDRAAAAYEGLVRDTDRPDPGVLTNLGSALRQLGRLEDAARWLERAVAESGRSEAVIGLAGLHVQLGQPDSAIDLLLTRLHDQPTNPLFFRHLASAHRAAGDGARAQSAARRAALLDPTDASALNQLAEAAENGADLERACRLATRVLALDPSSLGAGLVQAAVARRSGDPQRSIALCERWADSAPASSRHLVLFEKARALEALRDTEAALATFTAANAAQLANTRPPRDPDRAFAQVAALTALHRRGPPAMTPPAGQDPEGPGREGNDLLFVVGFPRSGTTLLDQMLDAHPEIQVIEERPLVAAMIADLAAAGRAYPADLPRLDAELLDRLRGNYRDRMARHLTSAARTYTVDKMPLNLVHVALIRQVFPAARFILALRHPCDVVLSCFMQSFALNDWMAALTSLDRAADLYSAAFGAWESYVASVPTPAITVRYEDVVDDLEREARRITEFLEIPFEPAMLAFHQHARTRGVLSTPSAAQVTQPIYRTALARWRRYDAAMRPIAERLAPEIARYGYAETRP